MRSTSETFRRQFPIPSVSIPLQLGLYKGVLVSHFMRVVCGFAHEKYGL